MVDFEGPSVTVNNGGDWVTTGANDAAQSFLASAVSTAADSRPWSLPGSAKPSSGTGWPPSQAANHPPPPPNPAAGGPPVRAVVMPAAASAPEALSASAAHAAAGVLAAMPTVAAPAGDGVTVSVVFPAISLPGSGGKSVLIHYEGHRSRYDEWIAVQSPRLAPFRSRTSRPLSVTMQSVERVVHGASGRCGAGRCACAWRSAMVENVSWSFGGCERTYCRCIDS